MAARFSSRTAIALVIANMVGTGVFTSLGFQLVDIKSPLVLLLLWVIGGVTALCGALCYAELSVRLPRSGGEYNFLARTLHPSIGFVSGWISITVGFAAPVALAAMTFEAYISSVIALPQWLLAVPLIVLLGIFHGTSYRGSGVAQISFTLVKVVLVIVFCAAVLLFGERPQALAFNLGQDDIAVIFGGAFAVSLIYVNYAYTGWNAATYIIDELEDHAALPAVLVTGTAVVMLLYLLLNYTFLVAAPMPALEGRIEVGVIAAQSAFGESGGGVMALVLGLLLISTVSAMILAGPRVLAVIGQDYPLFGWLAVTSDSGLPRVAIAVLVTLAILFVLTGTFESVLLFSGFILALNTLATVTGLLLLRWREGRGDGPGYRTPAWPLPAMAYLVITLWTLGYILLTNPAEALAALAMVSAGFVLYGVSRRFS